MSDYGSPGPQGSYGQGVPSQPPATSGSAGDPAQLITYTAYAGAAFGVLGFVWGFLPWLTADVGASASGYEGIAGGAAAIGLTLAAGLWAGANTFEKKETSLAPAAIAAAALLVTVGQLIKHTEGAGVGIGLILTLVTTILQTAALAYGWLLASGRMAAPAPKPQQPQGAWAGQQGAPAGYNQGTYGPSGQYGQPPASSYPQPGQYGPPQGNPQQGNPQQGGPQQQAPQSAPPSPPNPYGPPSGAPSYGPPSGPSQSGTTSSMPAQDANPYQPPQGGSGEDESGAGYGEATRHIPRYSGPGANPGGGSEG